MKISYFIKRNILMTRIRVEGTIKDKSTGITMTGETFDMKAKRFHKKSPNCISYNKLLSQLEASVYDDVQKGTLIKSTPKFDPSTEVTFLSALDEYNSLIDQGIITSRKSNIPISDQTKRNIQVVISLIKRHGIDFNFSRVNATTPMAKPAYEVFISKLKSAVMANVEPSSAWTRLSIVKMIVKYICDRHSIELGSLLDGMVIKFIAKEVVVISPAQVEYVIANYKEIRSTLTARLERAALDYWVAALMLNSRKMDLMIMTKDNLYYQDGKMWVRYKPHKTQNSSSVVVNVPVPPMLAEIFNRNLLECGRPLLPCIENIIPHNIKMIAKRLPIFQGEVQVYRRGKYVSLPQWQTLTLHQMRASGMTDKLGGGMPEALVKAYSGHTIDSKSFRRYVNIRDEAKERYADQYFAKFSSSGTDLPPQKEANHN